MRDRLIELIKQAENQETMDFLTADLEEQIDMSGGKKIGCSLEYLVYFLLEHGIIVPPCKVGARVYVITSKTSNDKNFYIFEDTITHYRIVEGCTIMCFENHLGVFIVVF